MFELGSGSKICIDSSYFEQTEYNYTQSHQTIQLEEHLSIVRIRKFSLILF
jgi:hypothetical protein